MFRQGVLREHSSLLVFVMRLLDLVAVAAAGWLAHRWIFDTAPLQPSYKMAIALGLAFTLVCFSHFQLYRTWRGTRTIVELRTLAGAWISVLLCLVAINALMGLFTAPVPVWMIAWLLIGGVLLGGFRVALRAGLRWLRAKGRNQRSVVIVGVSERGRQIARRLHQAAWTGLRVEGYFDERCPTRTGNDPWLPCLGTLKDLADYVERNRIDQVWLSYPLKAEDRVKEALYALRHSTVDVRYVLDIFAFNLCNHSINEVAGVPILNLSASPLRGMNAFVKELEDRLLALAILTAVSPLMIAIAIGVKLSSPGPVFYRQERVSWNNRRFMMLKFRSMPVDVEKNSGAVWAKAGEERATMFGAFLRKTSLDELPQFINVLKGDMSIVGPRPERPVFVEQFKDEIPMYMKKHMVKAGITGWAQIHGWRGDTNLSKRIEHDIYYIENWSFWLDVKIVFLTLFKGFINKNAY